MTAKQSTEMNYEELHVAGRYDPAAFHNIAVLVESIEGVRIKRMGFEVKGTRFCGTLVIELAQSVSIKPVLERLQGLKWEAVINSNSSLVRTSRS
jgi:hypothetical protein